MDNLHNIPINTARTISAVLTDVDGTLVTKDKLLTERALHAVKQLRERVAWGITMFTIMFADMAPPQTVELFAREVMPAFA